MSVVSEITNCRICKNGNLIDVITLGEQVITSRFPLYGDYTTPKTPVSLCMCQDCGLLQLRQTTFSSELYEYEYGYRSGISNTMRTHLKQFQEEILTKVNLQDGDIIVDIGSNDSTMLQYYSNKLKRKTPSFKVERCCSSNWKQVAFMSDIEILAKDGEEQSELKFFQLYSECPELIHCLSI